MALAGTTGLLAAHFDRKELARREDRLQQLASADLVAAIRQAVEAAEAAITTAFTVSTTTSVVS